MSSPQAVQTQNYALSMMLEQLPGGELVTWLKAQLPEEQFYDACDYVLQSIISQLLVACNETKQNELNDLLEKEEFETFFEQLAELLDGEKTPEASIFQYQLISGLQLGFEAMVEKYNLDLDK